MSFKFGSFALPCAVIGATLSMLTGVTAAPASAAVVPAKVAVAPASDNGGYAWISYYRSLAGLAPVSRNAQLESQDAVHVRYLANSSLPCENNVHDEQTTATPGCGVNPAATAGGKAAANNSDITRVSVRVSDRQAVSNWFGAAFHALTLLDPRLQSTGYAAYYTPSPKGAKPMAWPFTAAADVYRGRSGTYNGSTIAFPANNATTPLLSYQVGTESPEPFRDALPSSCVGWGDKSTVSAPLIVQWPIARGVPSGAATITDLTSHSAQPTCALTAASYANGSLPSQFLGGANGITKTGLFYGANPFVSGHRYQLSVGGRVITTFNAGDVPRPSTLAVQKVVKAGSLGLVFRDNQAARHLNQVWTGRGCTGTLVDQRWTGAQSTSVAGLRSGRTYSVRAATVTGSGAARWSACTDFRQG